MTPLPPEQEARKTIDRHLAESGWVVQNREEANLSVGHGVAIREFKLKAGHGFADYLLFVDGQAVGVLEAKAVGHTLSGVEIQAEKYSKGLPDELDAPCKPLPFCYISTGEATHFFNGLDHKPRSRGVFQLHRPETLAEWLKSETLATWGKSLPDKSVGNPTLEMEKPSTLRSRLQIFPSLETGFLYPNQVRAVTNLEKSLREDRPRSLIQMATGSGKTIMAVTAIYRLIKFGGARRVLFLVDRGNLGEQAEKEFYNFRTPDDNRKFTELYKVQRLTSATIGASTKVVISTIQRLYSMLRGRAKIT
jgi:type I restriction enzyme R subunit